MLPIQLPIKPMLARSADSIPEGPYGYEPKWDGYRCILVRDGELLELGSRGAKPLTRYFPELLPALAALPPRCVLDGEVVVRAGEAGAEHLSWDLLSQRIHPADSRIHRLAEESPAEIVCFDMLALDDDDWSAQPYQRRRARLEELLATPLHPRLHLSAMTLDRELAQDWFTQFEGAGLDGVVAKRLDGAYEQGKRSMVKVKHHRTAEAVVVGYRVAKDGDGVGSLLLGMYDGDHLVRVGGIVGLPKQTRRELVEVLAPLVLDHAAAGPQSPRSRFSSETDASFVPVAPELVVEVAFDQLEGNRFRHAVGLRRWRPDREPTSCRIDQVERAVAYDLAEVLTERF